MANKVGNVYVAFRLRNEASRQFQSALGGMRATALKFAAGMGAINFFRTGIKQQSDFVENWSIVANSAGKAVQDAFMNAFSTLKRTSKAEAAGIAGTIVGTMKSKGISEDIIASLGPQILKRLEDTGAFFNKTSEEVERAFTSMISGMARPMEMLTRGAVVPLVSNLDLLAQRDFGMKFEKLAPDQQTLERMKFFLEGTAKVPFLVNNSAKTIGTYKGSLDAFKKSIHDTSAAFMSTLMPALSKVMGLFAKVADWVERNKQLVISLGVAFAAFKVGSMLFKLGKLIAAWVAVGAAKASAQGGLFGLATGAAYIAGMASILAGVGYVGGKWLTGMGSSSASTISSGTSSNGGTGNIVVNVSSVETSATSNGQAVNVMSNFGRGGS